MIFDVVTNKLFKGLLDGTVQAGNAKKLGGLSADNFFKSTTQQASVNANALTDEGNYFVINGTNTPEQHGFVEVKNYHTNGFKPATDWGLTYCVRQVFYPYRKTGATVLPKTRFGLLKTALSTEWEWSEWENFADGGNANKVNGLTLYKSFGEIGGTVSQNTPILDLVKAMSSNSILVATIYNPTSGIYPSLNGVVEINKTGTGQHTTLKFIERTSDNTESAWFGIVQDNANYWSGWFKNATTADLANYLPKNGGTANNITLKNAASGYGMLYKNHTDTADYGTYLKDFSVDGKEVAVYLMAIDNAFKFKDNSGVFNDILHTGNSTGIKFSDTAPSSDMLWAHL